MSKSGKHDRDMFADCNTVSAARTRMHTLNNGGMRPHRIFQGLRFSAFADALLPELITIASPGSGKMRWDAFVGSVLGTPRCLWNLHAAPMAPGPSPAAVLTHLIPVLAPQRYLLEYRTFLCDPDHPLFSLIDADAFWDAWVRNLVKKGAVTAAFHELGASLFGLEPSVTLPADARPPYPEMASVHRAGLNRVRSMTRELQRYLSTEYAAMTGGVTPDDFRPIRDVPKGRFRIEAIAASVTERIDRSVTYFRVVPEGGDVPGIHEAVNMDHGGVYIQDLVVPRIGPRFSEEAGMYLAMAAFFARRS